MSFAGVNDIKEFSSSFFTQSLSCINEKYIRHE
jgi:hypothetical protein